ncbi:MAG: DUF1015 family protein [Acidobacteria bacterium]|nr:DUF1015 family protein [Acidobacteriota bacterium]
MSAILPFKALRPAPEAASAVAAVPYDVVSRDEAQALAGDEPLSFLHVSRAEIDLPRETDPHADAVYARAASNFAALRDRAPLVLEDTPSLYVYRLWMGEHTQTGIGGCFSVAEYDADLVKKHERTRPDKEDDRTRHIIELRAQTGPVFLIHAPSADVAAIVARTTRAATAPLCDFTAVDGVRHTLWRIDGEDQRALIAAFGAMPALYIADGHHRAASAARARQHFGGSGRAGEWDGFLAVAFPGDQTQILPYNRVVKDLGAHTPDGLLALLRRVVTVTSGPATPVRKGDVSMFLAGDWYTIELGLPPSGAGAAEQLDVSRLQDLVLAPLLGIGDVRTDTRIDFVGGARGTAQLESLVSSGEAAVAFSMYPVSVSDLMAISDAGGIMPPKSTWFEPKLRDGLLSHLI